MASNLPKLLLIFLALHLSLSVQLVHNELVGEIDMEQQLRQGESSENKRNCENDGSCVPAPPKTIGCLDRLQLLGLDTEDKYVLVEARIGQTIQLDCHFCNEKEENSPKVWYQNSRFFSTPSDAVEIDQQLGLPASERKYFVGDQHRLTVKNFSASEGALYFCQDRSAYASSVPKFNFIVDVVPSRNLAKPIFGNSNDFSQYYKKTAEPANKHLIGELHRSWIEAQSQEEEEEEVNFKISYDWGKWGKCNICGREKGIQRRLGKCRLVIPLDRVEDSHHGHQAVALRLMKFGVEFSCHSLILHKFLHENLANEIRNLADFMAETECWGVCNFDFGKGTHGSNETLTKPKVSSPKLSSTIFIVPGDSAKLECPVNPENFDEGGLLDITWIKDGKYLEPQVYGVDIDKNVFTISNFNEEKEQAGTYTCSIGGELLGTFVVNAEQLPEDGLESTRFSKETVYLVAAYSVGMISIWILLLCLKRMQMKGYRTLKDDEQSVQSSIEV